MLKGADLGLLDWLYNHPILTFFTPRVLLACELLVRFFLPTYLGDKVSFEAEKSELGSRA